MSNADPKSDMQNTCTAHHIHLQKNPAHHIWVMNHSIFLKHTRYQHPTFKPCFRLQISSNAWNKNPNISKFETPRKMEIEEALDALILQIEEVNGGEG